jgi:hypothetical protein
MTGWGPLLLLYLFANNMGKGRGGSPRGAPPQRPPDPFTFPPADKPPVPAKYTPGAPAAKKPAPGDTGTGAWVTYDSGGVKMPPAVIARAKVLLNDKTAHETIEPDPSRPGEMVRYLRTTDNPPGHTSVTAWRPRVPATKGVAV